jgi:ribosome biogenesis GTPase
VIHALLPRQTTFSRKTAGAETEEQVVAANVDVVFIVSALVHDLNLRRLERYLAATLEGGADPVLVLTKSDLCDDVPSLAADVEAIACGAAVHAVSNVTGRGVDELRRWFLPHRTVALLGSSGVGKSSLVNLLVGEHVQGVGELRDDGRGRHTTSHRELILLPGGGLVLDTPGMRELQLWDADAGLEFTFDEVERLATGCRFTDCRHEREPGCAVQAALGTGGLDLERLAGWQKLQRELSFLHRKQNKRAESAERRRWRALNREFRERDRLRP